MVFGTTDSSSAQGQAPAQYPAVTITVAKRKGTNATDIANAVLKRVHEMQGVTDPQRCYRHHYAQLRRDRQS